MTREVLSIFLFYFRSITGGAGYNPFHLDRDLLNFFFCFCFVFFRIAVRKKKQNSVGGLSKSYDVWFGLCPPGSSRGGRLSIRPAWSYRNESIQRLSWSLSFGG